MEFSLPTWTKRQSILAAAVGLLLVASFAFIGILVSRTQASFGAAPGCPDASAGSPATNVGVSFSISANTETFVFHSLVNESPSGGIPGLIKYCVFYSGADPTSHTVDLSAKGADGTLFTFTSGGGALAYGRGSGGNLSNIELTGPPPITMGTATWAGSPPAAPTFLLHIIDASVCGSTTATPNGTPTATPNSCWVDPEDEDTTPTPTTTATATATKTVPTPTSTATATATPVTPTATATATATATPVTPTATATATATATTPPGEPTATPGEPTATPTATSTPAGVPTPTSTVPPRSTSTTPASTPTPGTGLDGQGRVVGPTPPAVGQTGGSQQSKGQQGSGNGPHGVIDNSPGQPGSFLPVLIPALLILLCGGVAVGVFYLRRRIGTNSEG